MHVFRKTPTNVGKGVFHDPGKTGRHYFYLLVDATDDFLLGGEEVKSKLEPERALFFEI